MVTTRRTRKSTEEGEGHETKRQKKGQQKQQQQVTDAVLDEHLMAARPFIIRNFVAKDGPGACASLWRDLAGTKWQQDTLVCSKALSCGLPPKELENNSILKDAGAVADLIDNTKSQGQAKELWDMVDQDMKQTRCVAFGAVRRGIPFNKINKATGHNLMRDKEALKDGVRQGWLPWTKLPMKYKKDVEFILAAVKGNVAPGFRVALDAVNEKDKSRLWYEWAVQMPEYTQCDSTVWDSAPRDLLCNRKLMLQVVAKAAFVLVYVGSSLKEDEEFLVTAIGMNPLALGQLSTETFRRFPSLLSVDRIQKFLKTKKEEWWAEGPEDDIPKEFWNDRGFVIETWLAAGGNLHSNLPNEHFDDEEIILTFAKQGCSSGWGFCRRMSERLRSDKAFILKLLGFAPETATGTIMDEIRDTPLYDDYGLQVFAASISPSYTPYRLNSASWKPHWGRQQDFRNFVRQQLREYRGFFQLICGIDTASASPLFALNQGSDANIKMTIASFVDIPTGAIQHLRKAGEHLNLSGDDEDQLVPAGYQRPNQYPGWRRTPNSGDTNLPDGTGRPEMSDSDDDIFASDDDEDRPIPPRQPQRPELFLESDSDSDTSDGDDGGSDDDEHQQMRPPRQPAMRLSVAQRRELFGDSEDSDSSDDEHVGRDVGGEEDDEDEDDEGPVSWQRPVPRIFRGKVVEDDSDTSDSDCDSA